jgi:Potential Queuosine, Q, salvage protein family
LSITSVISEANKSAAGLVNLLATKFPCFRDETRFEGKSVRLLKRAQILVADIWAAFGGEGYGEFNDIDKITMFAGKFPASLSHAVKLTQADYRVPQQLYSFGALNFSPPLEDHIRKLKMLPSGHSWEVQIRGKFVWSTQLIC